MENKKKIERSCDVTLLQAYLKEESTIENCPRDITNMIEFYTILYMIALENKETGKKLFDYTDHGISDSIYFLNEIGVEISKMSDISDLSGLENFVYEYEPSTLSNMLNELSIQTSRLMNYVVSESEDAIDRINSLFRSEYYDSIMMLNKLSLILAKIAKLNPHLYD